MLLLLAASLLSAPLPTPDTLPSRAAPSASAYLDEGARETVRRARERRDGVENTIVRYRTVSRSRVSLGLRALRRDRLFFRCESAVRVDWRRGEPARVEVLGGRQVIPLVARGVEPSSDCAGAVFDPAEDRLNLGLGGFLGGDNAFVRHPLASGSEADYRFRSGDTVTVRIPGTEPLRLVELQVIPRRSESWLVSGSLWLESGSHAVVRAVLRLARPFDLEADIAVADPDEADEVNEIPGLFKPIRADIRYMTVEYGLWNQRWWLPRLVALEGDAQVGNLARFPLKLEQTYSDFEVEALPPGVLPAVAAEETTVGSVCRGTTERRKEVRDSLRAAHPEFKVDASCRCTNNRCHQTVTFMPRDTQRVIAGEYLPASIFDEGETLVSRTEMDELLVLARGASPAPWQLARPRLSWGGRSPDLLRYNRVEGLSVGARAEWDLGRARTDATLRLGTADLEPDVVLGATREGPVSRFRVAAYRRLDAVDFPSGALGLGNSLSALLFGRDDGHYYRSLGAELTRAPAGDAAGVSWRVFAERQSAAEKSTDWSLPSLWSDRRFGGNVMALDADQAGAAVSWRGVRGSDPAGWRGGATLSAEGAAGTFAFARPSASAFGAAPLPGGMVGSVEVAAGTSFGEVPVQSYWFIGGPGTVRGYAGGTVAGEAFWRARGEVGRASPGARLVVFSDAGWAGPRDAFSFDPPLLSAGVGGSFLDGLVRLDLGCALRNANGCRLDLYLDGLM